jgi:hypothetical protein
VQASGVEGATAIKIPLKVVATSGGAENADLLPEPPPISQHQEPALTRPYRVSLYFGVPEKCAPGERVFDVYLQDQCVLPSFDLGKEAGSQSRSIVRHFDSLSLGESLDIRLQPLRGKPLLSGVELQVLAAAGE